MAQQWVGGFCADKTNICADMKNRVFYLACCLQAAQPVPFL
jgi:hypothetical protein